METKRTFSLTKAIGILVLATVLCSAYLAVINATSGNGSPTIQLQNGTVTGITGNLTTLYSSTIYINGQQYNITIQNGTITGHVILGDVNAQPYSVIQQQLLYSLPDKQVMLTVYDPIDMLYDPDRNVIWLAS